MDQLSLADVEALAPNLMECAATLSPADTMFSGPPRVGAIEALARYHITEGIGLSLDALTPPVGYGFSDSYQSAGLLALATYGDAARWTLPALNDFLLSWTAGTTLYTTLTNTITTLENAATSPTLVPGLPVANPQVIATEVAKAITLTGTDSDGDALSYAIVTQPAHGSLTGTPPNMTYTPAANYYGVDSFTFRTFKTSDATVCSTPAQRASR